MRPRSEARADEIINVVIELLDSEGYDAVQVRTVARLAHVSLATIYKLFGTREQLIVTAVERWMQANAYAELTPPDADESSFDILVRVLRTVFQPWERHPRMLEAHYRLRTAPYGQWLRARGMAMVKPLTQAALKDADPAYVSDLELISVHVERGVMARFADGEIEVTEILPILERSLRRLTGEYETKPTRPRRGPLKTTERPNPPRQRRTTTGRH
jgi:TetR/AcrR family transcriptional regulator, cholesterol catabolism regulator